MSMGGFNISSTFIRNYLIWFFLKSSLLSLACVCINIVYRSNPSFLIFQICVLFDLPTPLVSSLSQSLECIYVSNLGMFSCIMPEAFGVRSKF